VELPEASICHQSSDRLRIRIASRRGDEGYFDKTVKELSRLRKLKHLEANPLTGSVLFIGENLDAAEIVEYARGRELFRLVTAGSPSLPLMNSLVQPVASVDRSLRTITAGKIDLPSGIFFALLGTGIYQLARGRFSFPPWYTAFWYAFGLFSMYVIEKAASSETARQAH
jgi:hypothetical protein